MNKIEPQNPINQYTKPKRKTFKIILLTILVVILGVGIWVGATAFSAIKKITALSGNGNIFSFLGDSRQALKGESEGRTNILLLGMGGKNHPGGMLTDTIMVMSIDWQTKKIALISIPRDLWVPIPGFGSAKINEAYADGEKNPKTTGGGGKLASETVSKILDIPIHYFVTVDFEGFKKMVDTVGGIDVTVDQAIYDPFYPASNMIDYDPFKISAGDHHLDGATALKYARSRKTTSDFDRSKRQAKVLAALKKRVVSLDILANPKKVTDLLTILGDHFRTDLSVTEVKSLWDSIKDLDTENIINKVFDTTPGGPLISDQDARGYVIIPRKGATNFTELQTIVKDIFEQENDAKDLKIEVLNGSGKAGVATTASDKLTKAGYTVGSVSNAPSKIQSTTVAYCNSEAKSTAQKIADLLSAEIVSKTTCQNVDISITIGQNAAQ